ncbi:putative membrane protein [Propionispora sp. 2/2-37]|uniref:hypothetical protein n=1 Tax=Propionispora sp. 2/2-37 TaxID=1677858 RepID=UPI0006C2D79D|nr:hypothetical protein [Propionispora sp. 2/2-37]CUH94139.1 putative membrane protein [Propionispora sp. 2/2-37]
MHHMHRSEARIVFRGLAALFIVIVLGVNIAEMQLNRLTQKQSTVQAFNIQCQETGKYFLYFLGNQYSIQSVYPIAGISNSEKEIVLSIYHDRISLPTCVSMDATALFSGLNIIARQCTDEILQAKTACERYLAELRQKF